MSEESSSLESDVKFENVDEGGLLKCAKDENICEYYLLNFS